MAAAAATTACVILMRNLPPESKLSDGSMPGHRTEHPSGDPRVYHESRLRPGDHEGLRHRSEGVLIQPQGRPVPSVGGSNRTQPSRPVA